MAVTSTRLGCDDPAHHLRCFCDGALLGVRRGLLTVVGAGLVASLIPGARAQSVPAAGSRTVRERHDLPGLGQEMVMTEVVFPPGMSAPLHHHPVPGLLYIVGGTAESAYAADPPRLYRAGDTLQDQADVPHTTFRNPDTSSALRFLIFYVLPPGRPYVIAP